VPPNSTFYTYIECLACRGIINGYANGCETGNPCFRPENNVTRGQMAKIVSNSAGFTEPAGAQQFEDVLPGSTFYDFVWRLAARGIVTGYVCGGVGEPCVGPGNLPYFRPNNNVTRGQLSKIVAEAAGLTQPVGAQQFEDVLPGSTFYDYIWRLTSLGIMNGYPCGGVGEPCVGPGNLPYFRPSASATRGQASKIVSNTFFLECQPVAPSPTATAIPLVGIGITANGFSPQMISGPLGTTFRWTNSDSVARSVVADNNSFNSGPINPGATWSYVPQLVISYPYHSGENASQTGVITLEDPIR
jgi:hypothetical protein